MPVVCILGLVGTMKGAVGRVLYMVAETVRGKSPLRLSPRF